MDAMTWQVVAAALGGIVGQFFKAQPYIKNWIPQVVMLALGTLTYLFFNPPKGDTVWDIGKYLLVAVVAGSSVNGTASFIGTMTPALKTQEAPK